MGLRLGFRSGLGSGVRDVRVWAKSCVTCAYESPRKDRGSTRVFVCVCAWGGLPILDFLVIVLSVQHFIGESVSQLPW